MRKIEKIFELLEGQNIKPASFERVNNLGNGYLKKTYDGEGDITNKMLVRIEKYSKNFYDQLMAEDRKTTNPEPKSKDDELMEVLDKYAGQPIIQVVLNLSYTGRKNADSIDKMADGVNKMAATNQQNTEIIAALVSSILPNSKLAAQLAASLSSLHRGDGLPVEAFLNQPVDSGHSEVKPHDGKKKVEGK